MMKQKRADVFRGWRRQVKAGGRVVWHPSHRDQAELRATRLRMRDQRGV